MEFLNEERRREEWHQLLLNIVKYGSIVFGVMIVVGFWFMLIASVALASDGRLLETINSIITLWRSL